MKQAQDIQIIFKCTKTIDDLTACNSDRYSAGCNKIINDHRGVGGVNILGSVNNGDKIHCGVFDKQSITYTPQPQWQRWLSVGLIALGLTTLNRDVFAQEKVRASAGDTTRIKHQATVDSIKQPITAVGFVRLPPEYVGGMSRFYDYLKNNLDAVSVSKEQSTVVRFSIEKDGTPVNVKLVIEGNNNVDRQLVRLIKKSRKWKPGIDNGQPLVVDYNCIVRVYPGGEFDVNVERVR
ncbi:energy transducer TonB [Mucilaginibacter gossypii]|uniref:energy transducer TonB n=1 Tax=Mucilaginibacter gossypii TaxID=551996 RepID=UPI0016782852|nr:MULTISPECIES: energy transducer TonB [Mucilaginibacter]QTE36836.1 energy transducer TonB [Mucilaginibacter gossypii]